MLAPYVRARLARHTAALRAVFDTYGSIGAGTRSSSFSGVRAQQAIVMDDAIEALRDAGLCAEGRLSVQQLTALAIATRGDQEPANDVDASYALQLQFADFCELVVRACYLERQRARGGEVGAADAARDLPDPGVDDQASDAHAAATRRFALALDEWVAHWLAIVAPVMRKRADDLAIARMQQGDAEGRLGMSEMRLSTSVVHVAPVDLVVFPTGPARRQLQ